MRFHIHDISQMLRDELTESLANEIRVSSNTNASRRKLFLHAAVSNSTSRSAKNLWVLRIIRASGEHDGLRLASRTARISRAPIRELGKASSARCAHAGHNTPPADDAASAGPSADFPGADALSRDLRAPHSRCPSPCGAPAAHSAVASA